MNQIYRVRDVETSILAGAQSAAIVWKFPRAGVVRGYALGASTVANRGGIALSIYRRGRFHLIDEFGESFIPALNGGGPDAFAIDWDRFLAPVLAHEEWIFKIQNESAGPITPRLFLSVTLKTGVDR